MRTVDIRQRVRDNLNRSDPGIDAKIQSWINDAKRFLEQVRDYDYMRSSTVLTVSGGSPSASLPDNLKSIITVSWRQPGVVLRWLDLPRLSEEEVESILQYDESGNEVTGPPRGYTATDASLTVWPKPDTTYQVRVVYWAFSDDWTFGPNEEPYLAKFGWVPIIALATAFGYEYLGELQDAEQWRERFARLAREFAASEMSRALEGDLVLRPSTRSNESNISRGRGLLGI